MLHHVEVEAECPNPFAIAYELDLADLVADHPEGEHHPRLAAWCPDSAHHSVDQCRLRTTKPADKRARHVVAAVDLDRTEFARGVVDSHHYRGIEIAQQGLEVAVPRGGEERAHQTAMPRLVSMGGGVRLPDPASCSAGQLPGGDRALPQNGRDLFKRNIEHVVEDKRHPLTGSELI